MACVGMGWDEVWNIIAIWGGGCIDRFVCRGGGGGVVGCGFLLDLYGFIMIDRYR